MQRGSASSPESPEKALQKVDLATHDVVPVVGLPAVVTFNPRGSKKTFKKAEEADKALPTTDEPWDSFWTIETGVEKNEKGGMSFLVAMPVLDAEFGTGESSIYEKPKLSVDAKHMLKVDISVALSDREDLRKFLAEWPEDKGPKPPAFESIHLAISLATGQVHGHYYELAPDDTFTSQDPPIHALYAAKAETHQGLKHAVTEAIETSDFACMELALTCDLYNPSANIHSPPAPLGRALGLSASRTLSVTELQLLEAPDSASVNNLAQNYMMAAAGLWKGQKEKDVFGDGSLANRVLVPSELKDGLSDDNRKFLAVYSRALCLWSLAGNDVYSKHFTDEQRDRLAYWWKGKVIVPRGPSAGMPKPLTRDTSFSFPGQGVSCTQPRVRQCHDDCIFGGV
ncbi:hypothetical protein IMZ48_02025 [Candidatus Bathyarchaeota archaeon]|nr:hypothetical protein [Candidatus Bathyarchaeota archaeon]